MIAILLPMANAGGWPVIHKRSIPFYSHHEENSLHPRLPPLNQESSDFTVKAPSGGEQELEE